MVRQDRDFASREYENLAPVVDDYYDRSSEETDNRSAFNDSMYGDLMQNGQAGYSPDQRRNMEQYDSELDGLQFNDAEYEAANYSPEEYGKIQGDPGAARRNNFDPGREQRTLEAGHEARRGALSQTEDEYGAVDEGRVRSDPQYGDDVRGSLSRGRSETSAAVDRGKLSMDPNAAAKMRMSDGEVQDTITAAGQDAGAVRRGEIDDIQRKAAASGVSPVGMAALEDRTLKNQAIEGADAMTRARIGARGEQARREGAVEGMRLGAEQGLSDRQMSVADRNAARDIDAYGDIEHARQSGEQAAAGVATRRAEYNGANRLGEARDMANQRTDMERDQQVRGYDYDAAADDKLASRNQAMARDRVQNEQYAQTQRYNRGMDRFGVRAGRQANYATTENEQRRGDQREARGYFTGQGNAARQDRQFGLNQRTGMYSMGNQAAQGATGNAMNNEKIKASKPSFWDRVTGVASRAASAFGY